MSRGRGLNPRVQQINNIVYHPIENTIMTSLKIKGSWNEVKGKIKQKYASLTDDDLLFAEGKDDELLGRLQTKTGESKEQLREYIESL